MPLRGPACRLQDPACPPRETTADTSSGRRAAAVKAAAAPVLAPNRPTAKCATASSARIHSRDSSIRLASKAMSKTLFRSSASSGNRRSNSSVASPARLRARETDVLRGLSLLEPLPCAKTTIPFAAFGTASNPGSLLGENLDFAVGRKRYHGHLAQCARPHTAQLMPAASRISELNGIPPLAGLISRNAAGLALIRDLLFRRP